MAFKLRSSNPSNVPLTWTEMDNNLSYLLINMSGSKITLLGPSYVTGSLTLSGSATPLTLYGTSSMQHILPSTNNIYSLGSSGFKWNTVYATTFSGTAFSGSLYGTAATASNITPAITNDTDNSVITSNGNGTLTAEGDFTFDGTTSTVTMLALSLQQGDGVQAIGPISHAEGNGTVSSGSYSHAEGNTTIARGNSSHAEGYYTTSSGDYSHAEGNNTTARGIYSHAEGASTVSSGSYSHAEGSATTTKGEASHAEGISTIAFGTGSHAEGLNTVSSGSYSHAEGESTVASGIDSHAEGYYTTARGNYSHTDGYYTIATASGSYAGGAYASSSHAYEWSRSNTSFGQYGTITLYGTTVNTADTELSIGGTGVDYFTIPTNTAYYVDLTMMALRISDMTSKVWNGKTIIRNNAGTTSIDGTGFNMTFITGSTAFSANVNVNANDANDKLAITGSSGGAYGTIRWFAKADYIKLIQ